MGPDRELRKAYEASLARAQDLSASSIRSARDSVATALSRSVWTMLACLLVALAPGADHATPERLRREPGPAAKFKLVKSTVRSRHAVPPG